MISEAAGMDTCTLDWDQLYELLFEALKRFQCYSDQYGYDEEQAKQRAILATLAELQLDSPLCGFALD
jgi:hypothetical protein